MHRNIPILICLLLTGCSWNMLTSGKHKKILAAGTSRAAVIAELGTPHSSHVSVDLLPRPPQPKGVVRRPVKSRLDTYYTREILPDWESASGAGEAAGMTMGLSELITIPGSLGHFIPRQKRLTILYNESDRLSHYFLANARRDEP